LDALIYGVVDMATTHLNDNAPNLMQIPPKIKSNKPKYTKFSQQELAGCKPVMTPTYVMATLMLVGAIFIPIGSISLHAAGGVVEIVKRYEDVCLIIASTLQNITLSTIAQKVNYIQDPTTPKNCTIALTIPHYMKQPVYVYYELQNFYQNHRRYVKSRDDAQLKGKFVTNSSLASCKPEDFLDNNPIVPCGLIAWSFFNDSYVFTLNNVSLPINKTSIAWHSDIKVKFGAQPSNFPNNNINSTNSSTNSWIGGGALNPSVALNHNEDFLVWMRAAALPNFRKLWGRIEQNLYDGDVVTINILNVYNTYSFHGKKKIVLSTSSWIGGKNNFLGCAYLCIGCMCFLLAFSFFLMYRQWPRALGDTSYFSWHNSSQAKICLEHL
jgi:hypothetical protein